MASSTPRLADRVAVVTGGAQGIGAAIARRFAAEGADVVIADIDVQSAKAVAAEIVLGGGKAETLHVDIAQDASTLELASAVEARFGRCDILVNNAAILDATPVSLLTPARYREVVEVNQHGAVRVSLAFLPLLRKGRGVGRVLNIVSIMGLLGSRDAIAYSVAKGGLVNFTRALACDLAQDNILVNAIAPGFVDTRMAQLPDGTGHEHETSWFRDVYLKHRRLPLGRAAQPDDIAGPALFFCSDDARYVTGQILAVDGGVTATF